jgi:hypothetical protein
METKNENWESLIGKEVLINQDSGWVIAKYIGCCLKMGENDKLEFSFLAKDKFGSVFNSKMILPIGCLKGFEKFDKSVIVSDECLKLHAEEIDHITKTSLEIVGLPKKI